jgi:copper transport protein
VVSALALPAAALAHAALLRTVPEASRTLNAAPPQVALTFSEPVEPRFAIVSVTDAGGHLVTAGRPHRAAADVDTLDVPLKKAPEGWYLVFWRVISVDGHPVRGAFTFAVGPNPGPAPQFVIPSISETAAKPSLLVARWIVFLSAMSAIGLFVLRMATARPVVRRVPGASLRRVSLAFAAALAVALVATPVYLLLATAQFALRSWYEIGALVPLVRDDAFGRGYVDLELLLALFAIAAGLAIAVDRPERERRSVAELLALTGALLAAAAALLIPGLAGHAAQTSPRGLAVALDWVHLVAGSIWIGGLAGLLVLWRSLGDARRTAGLAISVPRFSNTAFVSVLALIGAGTGAAVLHLPTLASLWQTSYGKALLAKIAILAVAMGLAAVNLLRTKPQLQAAAGGPGAARLLRRLVSGEVLLVAGAIFAAALLSSLAPPAKALASLGKPSAHVGPGEVIRVVQHGAYRLELRVLPNRAAVPSAFTIRITRGGKPVRGADVTTTFTMLDMEMGQQAYHFAEVGPGVYSKSVPALVMVGRWGLQFEVQPPGGKPFTVLLVDRANG